MLRRFHRNQQDTAITVLREGKHLPGLRGGDSYPLAVASRQCLHNGNFPPLLHCVKLGFPGRMLEKGDHVPGVRHRGRGCVGFALVSGHQRPPSLPRTLTSTPYTDQLREVPIRSAERKPHSLRGVLGELVPQRRLELRWTAKRRPDRRSNARAVQNSPKRAKRPGTRRGRTSPQRSKKPLLAHRQSPPGETCPRRTKLPGIRGRRCQFIAV